MAATVRNPSFMGNLSPFSSSFIIPSKSLHGFSFNPLKPPTLRQRRPLVLRACFDVGGGGVVNLEHTTVPPEKNISLSAPDEPRKGGDVLVEALEREDVTTVFSYPGSESMVIHQALKRSHTIRSVPHRPERGGVSTIQGYARASRGFPGVCFLPSGPGATDFVSVLADAVFDGVPIVAITGQETPIVEEIRSLTKRVYLLSDVKDIPRVVREAFSLASSGQPGPVLISIPTDIQQQLVVPKWDRPMAFSGYMSSLPKPPNEVNLQLILNLIIRLMSKSVLYVGGGGGLGGCSNSSRELKRFVERRGIPVASTLMDLGAHPCLDELSLQMLGMHGSVNANYAADGRDLLLASGVRFGDFVTGKVEAFRSLAKIVHSDIDFTEIGKNKQPHVSVFGDMKLELGCLTRILEEKGAKLKHDFLAWGKVNYPLICKLNPVLDKLIHGNAVINTGAGQHQIWAMAFTFPAIPLPFLMACFWVIIGFSLPTFGPWLFQKITKRLLADRKEEKSNESIKKGLAVHEPTAKEGNVSSPFDVDIGYKSFHVKIGPSTSGRVA